MSDISAIRERGRGGNHDYEIYNGPFAWAKIELDFRLFAS